MFPAIVYQAALNSSVAGQYFLSPSENPIFLEVNDTFLEQVNLKREDIIGKRLFEVFPAEPGDRKDTGLKASQQSLRRVIETGNTDKLPLQRYPIRITQEDGTEVFEERYWCASNTPIFDESGVMLYISHQTNEVTNRVYVEEALKKSEARYRSLTESIDEGFCVIEVLFNDSGHPSDYVFHEVNPTFEAQTGLHDVIGKTMRQLVPHHESHWFEKYGQVAKLGIPLRFENSAKALERVFDVYAYPIDEQGEHMVGILFKDITKKKKDEEQLRLSEARLRALTYATADIVYRMSPDWSEIHELQGRGCLDDVIDPKPFRFEDYVPSEEHERLHQAIQKAIAEKSKFELEFKVIMADGSIGWVESRAIPMFDETSGEIREWIGVSGDITSRKQAEEELREAARRKDDFLAMLAHELRNPLAPISAGAHILSLAKHDPVKVEKYSGIILRQVAHMTDLIDDLLDVSRVTRGLITLGNERVELREVIIQSIEQVRPIMEKHQHRFTLHESPNPIYVNGDKNRLIQVVTNILNNSAKYTPNSGQVVVELTIESPFAKITVTDNGVGMEPELINEVFELFSQAKRTSDRSQGGLGIGLALAKSLVELHHGEISVKSEGIGKGSQFTILLPMLNDHQAHDATEYVNTEMHKIPVSSQIKIMVVDDNADAANMVAALLELSGYHVTVAYDAMKALELAKKDRPDALILDLGLPNMDGKELAKLLRGQAETTDATLIALTGYSEEHESEKAQKAGFDHFFVKPVDVGKLLEVLSKSKHIKLG